MFFTEHLASIVEKTEADKTKNKVKTVTPCPISALLLLKLFPISGNSLATI